MITTIFLVLLHVSLCFSEEMNGMDMDMDMASPLAGFSMPPYLHFTKMGTLGQNIWFEGWAPSSGAATLGACVGLFLFALSDRWISAMRRVGEQCALLRYRALNEKPAKTETESQTVLPTQQIASAFSSETELSRSLMQAVQSTFWVASMLVVMTFNVAFIFALLAGLVFGEVLYGRYGHAESSSID